MHLECTGIVAAAEVLGKSQLFSKLIQISLVLELQVILALTNKWVVS